MKKSYVNCVCFDKVKVAEKNWRREKVETRISSLIAAQIIGRSQIISFKSNKSQKPN